LLLVPHFVFDFPFFEFEVLVVDIKAPIKKLSNLAKRAKGLELKSLFLIKKEPASLKLGY